MKKRKGFAIVFTLGIVGLVLLAGYSFFAISSGGVMMSSTSANATRAYYLAEAALARKFIEVKSGNINSFSNVNFTLATGKVGKISASAQLLGGTGLTSYRIDASGQYGGVTRNVSITVKQVTCARYSYLSNDEDRLYWQRRRWEEVPVWFITGDRLRGPLHTNDTLHISGDPIFEGPVTISAAAIDYYHSGPPDDNPEFRDSLTMGVPLIQMPTTAETVTNLRTQSQSTGGLYLTGNTVVTLLSNGTMNVSNAQQDPPWVNKNVALPANKALFVDNGYVDISGILNGQLSVGTNNNIYVVNSILYNNDPRANPSSTDMLGLVSQNNVYVDATAPSDLEIDAYIVALNTSFGAENYDSVLKGTLSIYGGITQARRGPIGTFNGTTGDRVSGYTKDYYYDERFANSAPPYFPGLKDGDGLTVYVKDHWNEI